MFGSDVRVPGMLYAVCLRPPAFGVKLDTVNEAPARAVKGVMDIFQIPSGIAVVDAGITINPRGVEAQIQGGFMDGLAT